MLISEYLLNVYKVNTIDTEILPLPLTRDTQIDQLEQTFVLLFPRVYKYFSSFFNIFGTFLLFPVISANDQSDTGEKKTVYLFSFKYRLH